MNDDDKVILVDADDRPIGSMGKLQAHTGGGVLHRAVSVFVSNTQGELLVQRRARSKYHFGGAWSNTCCSHPRPEESAAAAARRRLHEEMGVTCELTEIFSFAYEARSPNGLIEREIDHVFVGRFDGYVVVDPQEVAEFRWSPIESLQQEIADMPDTFTPWFPIALGRVIDYLNAVNTNA